MTTAPRPGQPVNPPVYGRLDRDMFGEAAFVICGGSSLTGFDFNRLRGYRVAAVNSSYLAVPFADFVVFTDPRWYDDVNAEPQHQPYGHAHRPEFWAMKQRISVARYVEHPDVLRLARLPGRGLSRDPGMCIVGPTTVLAAINVLVLRGVERIGLLGFDGGPARGGATWHHEPHPAWWTRVPECWQDHGNAMRKIKPELDEIGVMVWNLNPLSGHRMFPFIDIDKALEEWR